MRAFSKRRRFFKLLFTAFSSRALVGALVLQASAASADAPHRVVASGDESTSTAKVAQDGRELRLVRRVGVGLEAAGDLGLGGALIAINFNDTNGLVLGAGGAPKFESFALSYKHVLGSGSILPYAAVGYARWATAGAQGPIGDQATPGFLANHLLSENQRRTGNFAIDLMIPKLGLEWVQSSGPWAGSSVALELMDIFSASTFDSAVTGALDFIYYF